MNIRLSLVRVSSFTALTFVLSLGSRANAQMSETEKKAAARAAFQEGVKLQDDGKSADALTRFESAEKLFDAPTHLLHIAECQALTGRLVEASETYELLAHKNLGTNPPDVFVQAQTQGAAEQANLRARIPTLRVNVVTRPPGQPTPGLAINVNGVAMPIELVGIARPLNPGTYRFAAQANGWATAQPIDVPLGEKEQKGIDLVLVKSGAGPAVVVGPGTAPPPYVGTDDKGKPKREGLGTTSTGFLFGVRAGASVPGGNIGKDNQGNGVSMDQAASTGGAFGIDGYVRLAKMLLLGVTFEHDFLGGTNKATSATAGTVSTSAYGNYFGVALGILPSVDHFSFVGDIGLGSRSMGYKVGDVENDVKGLEFDLSVGLSFPIGPIRLVPRINLGIGDFSSIESTSGSTKTTQDIPSAEKDTHVFGFFGLAAYYSLDLGPKPE